MPKLTVKQFSDKKGIDANVANGVIKFLEKERVVTKVGKVQNPEGQRGRSANIYEFPEEVTFSV